MIDPNHVVDGLGIVCFLGGCGLLFSLGFIRDDDVQYFCGIAVVLLLVAAGVAFGITI